MQPPESLFTKRIYTTAFNVGGNPTLALCMGFTPEGMPLSLQIVGKLFEGATICGRAMPMNGWRPGATAARPSRLDDMPRRRACIRLLG